MNLIPKLAENIVEKLRSRAAGIEQWTRENEGPQKREDRSTQPGSPERLYWQYGYLAALKDIIGLLTRNSAELN